MAGSVHPIVSQIDQQTGDDPRPNRLDWNVEKSVTLINPLVNDQIQTSHKNPFTEECKQISQKIEQKIKYLEHSSSSPRLSDVMDSLNRGAGLHWIHKMRRSIISIAIKYGKPFILIKSLSIEFIYPGHETLI